MKRTLLVLAAATLLSSPAFAAKIGVSMDKFDDNFLTVLRNGMADYAKSVPGVTIQVEDAKDDVSKQLSQVQNFIANGVDAIIVNPVDTSATAAITKAAADANVPLVYVNREPADVDKLGAKAAFVASNEVESGTLETKEIFSAAKATSSSSRDSSPIRPRCSGPRTFMRSSRPLTAAGSRSLPSKPGNGTAPRART
jgi:inositol transport system substrate-binding protein